MASNHLPSIKELFQESWDTLKTTAAPLFKLTILSYVVMIAIGMVGLMLLVVFGALSVIGSTNPTQAFLNPAIIIPMAAILVVGIIGVAYFGLAMVAAQTLAVDKKGHGSVMQMVHDGFKFAPSLFVAGILSFILAFGSVFVFMFPMVIISFLLIFVNYEIIIHNSTPMAAIKRSYSLITQNFFEVLARWAALIGVYMLVAVVIPNLLMKISPELIFIVSGASFFINILLAWFSLIYGITLYKHVVKHSPDLKERSIAWMWIVAIIGWIIAGLMIFATFKLVSSGIFDNISKKAPATEQYNQYYDEYLKQLTPGVQQDSTTFTQ